MAKAKFPKRSVDSAEIPVGQRPDIVMPDLGEKLERGTEVVLPVDKPMIKETLDAMAFDNEWLTIIITPYASDNPPTHHFCAINGEGAELLIGNLVIRKKWLPLDQVLRIKRKYVEALLLSRTTTVKNVVDKHEGEDRNPTNTIQRKTAAMCNVNIREDKNPMGTEWLLRIQSMAA